MHRHPVLGTHIEYSAGDGGAVGHGHSFASALAVALPGDSVSDTDTSMAGGGDAGGGAGAGASGAAAERYDDCRDDPSAGSSGRSMPMSAGMNGWSRVAAAVAHSIGRVAASTRCKPDVSQDAKNLQARRRRDLTEEGTG